MFGKKQRGPAGAGDAFPERRARVPGKEKKRLEEIMKRTRRTEASDKKTEMEIYPRELPLNEQQCLHFQI